MIQIGFDFGRDAVHKNQVFLSQGSMIEASGCEYPDNNVGQNSGYCC